MMNEPRTLTCDSDERRQEIRRHDDFNGLDYVDLIGPTTLRVFFLKKAPDGLTAANVVIKGGRRPRYQNIQVTEIALCRQEEQDLDDCLTVTLSQPGDFSTYQLCLVSLDEDGRPTDEPFPGFDPRYACLDFNFKADCPSDLDCLPAPICPTPSYETPEINYLAKDYASFRQLILDRLAVTMPEWQERHAPDIGITLVEILAYVGDHLSYYQDAVATEAYLATARQRISVRRHARLVDYAMHEGCNARAWVHVHSTGNPSLAADAISFVTQLTDAPVVGDRLLTWDDLREIAGDQYEVFEPLLADPAQTLHFYDAHNCIEIYTWGDADCCLPRGATSVTLKDGAVVAEPPPPVDQTGKARAVQPPTVQRKLNLQVGDTLIFEEVIGPRTGNPADADPMHRQAVRLTRVEPFVDELYQQPLLDVEWAQEDALTFALCISTVGPAPACQPLENVSVARGNVLLVDYGRRLPNEALGAVPVAAEETCCVGVEQPSELRRIAGAFHPQLRNATITFSQPLPANAPAARLLAQDPRAALPWVRLHSELPAVVSAPPIAASAAAPAGETTPASPAAIVAHTVYPLWWTAQRDLLSSEGDDAHFVVEIDNEGAAHLRFGDGELGRAPAAGEEFTARYRVGNGKAGNVGRESIVHAISNTTVSGVKLEPRNPLPASGGVDPEPLAEVKLFAPDAFRRTLQRAITPEDYAAIVLRDFAGKVQRAAAVLRWTGSWYAVQVVVDPVGQTAASADLLAAIRRHLYRFRRMGHDVEVRLAEYVPLEIELEVCVLPAYLRGHVKGALQERFSNRRLANGQLGFFHPDRLTFGEGIFLSTIVATAQAVPGVESVRVKRLERQFEGPNGEIDNGILPLSALEVARLDNDPNFPENGRLILTMRGGR